MARALYIHWPFCLKKCPYCDFNSHVRAEVDHDLYANSLLADMAREAQMAGGETLTSIFFGGGTPSLMPPALVAQLIERAEALWGFASDIEITLEANPSSVEAARFAALAQAGVNRVSLGVQALDDGALRFLGRLHDASEALTALKIAQKHFARVSFDLIYARPDQSLVQWESELRTALAYGTTHMSLYQLTVEEGTRFASDVRQGAWRPLADDPAAEMFALTRAITAEAGLPAYEVSNHAQAGEQSRHNLTYWRYEDYAGIGPGAHGRRGGVATTRHRKPENWLTAIDRQGDGLAEARAIHAREQAVEALLMGLRLGEGVDLAAMSARFSLPQEGLIDFTRLQIYRDEGLVWQDADRIGVSETGMVVLDSLIAELLPTGLLVP